MEVYRDGSRIYTCKASSLFYKTDKIDEVDEGEFGVQFDWSERGFLPGDIIKCISRETTRRNVTWNWS
jgi:hypothetical protein